MMRGLLLAALVGCAKTPSEAGPASVLGEDASDTPTSADDTGSHQATDQRSAQYCAECHPTQYSEWNQSMHRYAAHSPVFDQMALKAHRDTAGGVGTFCTGCHSPIGTLEGEPGTTQAADRSDISLEGITCVVCHQAMAHEQPVGNTSLELDFSKPMQGPFAGAVSSGHASAKGTIIDTPELCGSCHDVFNFPGLRIEEAYTEYQSSPAAEAGLRCQDCHMGAVPGIPGERAVGKAAVLSGGDVLPDRTLSSHRFVGPDYSLIDSFPYADADASADALEEMVGRIDVLLKNAVKISDVYTEEQEDETALFVVIESLTPGHNVPTGFTSERQLWVEVIATDGDEVVFQSGDLDAFGDLRDHLSWEVIAGDRPLDDQLTNFQSLNLLRVGDVATATPEVFETVFPFDADFIVRRSLAPLEQRTLSYRLPSLSDSAEIQIRLRYRNLPPYVLRALQLDELVERLRIFDIDSVSL